MSDLVTVIHYSVFRPLLVLGADECTLRRGDEPVMATTRRAMSFPHPRAALDHAVMLARRDVAAATRLALVSTVDVDEGARTVTVTITKGGSL